jgi:hypothetical protein
VETPVRVRRDLWSRRALFTATGVVSVCTAIGGLLLTLDWPGRVGEKVLEIASVEPAAKEWPDDRTAAVEKRLPSFGSRQPDAAVHVLVWGDSHAKSIVPALAQWCEQQGKQGLIASYSATAPMLGFYRISSNGLNESGLAWSEAVLDTIREKRIPNTVLTAFWSKCPGSHVEEFEAAMLETVRRLSGDGTRVWILLDVPMQDFAVAKALAFHSMHPTLLRDPRRLAVTLKEHRQNNRVIKQLVPALAAAGARVLDPSVQLFNPDGVSRIEVKGMPLFKDGNHLTRDGALDLYGLFAPAFGP